MSRHCSSTSRLFGLARTSSTCSDIKQLTGHSPPRFHLSLQCSGRPFRGRQYDGRLPSALLARLSVLNRAVGFRLMEEMVRHKSTSLLPHPVRLQVAATPEVLSIEKYVALVGRVHKGHVLSLPLSSLRHGLAVRRESGRLICAPSPLPVEPAPDSAEPTSSLPLVPQCSTGGRDAPMPPRRPTVVRTSPVTRWLGPVSSTTLSTGN
ncbi:hypothetical protein E2C01_051797 [Portunus trituberculatus]|uniref:Uncharacterized protein n=1 Tax=Portunus trituberculatus TaxID=210409 RepID=A0A5B7GJR9_PORTR|nr:hypothetical protein [Portunus trituberculatus]